MLSLQVILEDNSSVEVLKKGGLRVLRARVTKQSRLIGCTAEEVKFRENYKAAIVAVQQGGKNVSQSLTSVKFGAGDILALQVSDDSLLLSPPSNTVSKRRFSLFSTVKGTDENKSPDVTDHEDVEVCTVVFNCLVVWTFEFSYRLEHATFYHQKFGGDVSDEVSDALWRDLEVLPAGSEATNNSPGSKEYLVAMRVSRKSIHAKKNVAENGIAKVPGVTIVSIERSVGHEGFHNVVVSSPTASVESQLQNDLQMYTAIDPDEPLLEGDLIWFAGDASAIGDLRKVPGLESPEKDEIKQMDDNVHDRLLVQAVVAKSGPLVGKTVREVQFRTKYGAAVISVHREGRRIHEHPGNIKLHAGDVLLLEAGPTFLKRNANNDHAFALLAAVKDSAPPRLKYFLPAIILLLAMLAVSSVDLPTAPLLVCALFTAIIMVTMGLLSPQEARDAIDWSLYVAIACAFGISQALTNSGLAAVCASFLIRVGEGVGIGGEHRILYFLTIGYHYLPAA